MKKIVQKFGGSSLNSAEKREMVVKHIEKAIKMGYKPVVVVSAMGRLGEPYATDTLIEVASEINKDIDNREKDLLMSCGEIISTIVLVQTLKKAGIEAIALTGAQAGIYTDDSFGEAEIIRVVPDKVNKTLKEGKIPVIAGFQGITEDGEITTLGRGGSDTTASIIAAAIGALYIEIYTDVAGVMTADPALVESARILDVVTYNEVCELAYQGARVIHPRAAEIAMKERIPIKIKSTFNDGPGTLINSNGMRKIKGDRPVTGVTSRRNIVFIKIIPENPVEYATGLLVFSLLAENDISVDFINIRSEATSFIIDSKNREKVDAILQEHNFNYKIRDDFVKVSVVGGGMTGRPGVMAKIVEALNKEKIKIYQTTDSHTTISCLVKREKEKEALNALHSIFELNL
ncbi:MAG: aspartate kinase [Halanaerobiales bacterium]|jgi:aspartate kinase|nr:aspartate kinase [Halanaerobiales bacterium]HPZ62520.1 aspartate kinase [Halanaerobiales bacterium]HQD03739.1 aspartate kinase [Halanaerobiales bacterium]